MDKYPEKTSVRIVEEYYSNNTQLFFDCMDENIIWIGPAINQHIEGKQNLLDAFNNESDSLKYRIDEMNSRIISGGSSMSCEVLLKFIVYTYYPSEHISKHHQRITLFWKKFKTNNGFVWRFSVIHISNGIEIDNRDYIYPLHYDEFEIKHFNSDYNNLKSQKNKKLIVRGVDYANYFIDYKDILYIRGGKGKICEIYTKDKVIIARLLIDDIKKQLPEQFYRPHRSYIVNTYDIVKLYRYKIVLKDNTEIPIPQKRYNQVIKETEYLMRNVAQA